MDCPQERALAAEQAGITGWELDRLMYDFKEEFPEALDG